MAVETRQRIAGGDDLGCAGDRARKADERAGTSRTTLPPRSATAGI